MKTKLTVEQLTLDDGRVTDAIKMPRTNAGADELCLCCGRKMKPSGQQYWVRVSNFNYLVPTALALPEQADLGYCPVGSECVKRFPAEFVLTFND